MQRKGFMLVLSAPSGAGKTTLGRLLREGDGNISLSVSVTTRSPRSGEIDGKDYYFVDSVRFGELRDAGELLEWAQVHGGFYGTPRAQTVETLAAGTDILFDIDWQGARQLRDKAADDVVSVFILPPSRETLEQRLRNRASDSEEVIQKRLAGAEKEIRQWGAYDYVIINDDLETSVAALRAIVAAERLKRTRVSGLAGFVDALLS